VVDKRALDARRWQLLAPRAEDVRNIAGVLDVRYRQLAGGGFNHGSALILLDAEGRILSRTEKMGTRPDPDFVAAVRRAVRAD
jgi:protein SCO1/2